MLLKLFKHEMRSLWHYCGIVVICVIVASIVFNLGMTATILINNDNFTFVSAPMLIFLGFCICSVLGLGIKFGIAFRFYRSMASDEGYLTHTLPVTVGQNVTAKLLAASVYNIGAVLFLLVFIVGSVAIAFIAGGDTAFIPQMLKDMSAAYAEFRKVLVLPMPVYVLEWTVFGIVGLIFSILVIYISVALGQLMKSHKLIWAVVYYMIITFVLQFITQIISLIMSFTTGITVPFITSLSNMQIVLVIQAIIIVALLVTVGLSAIAYAVVKHIFERKLNLE